MYKSLKNKAFRDLWIGQNISQFGDAGYYFMFTFFIQKLTHSPTMVGYMGAIEALPFLLLGPTAGVFADRFDRKKIMLRADFLSALLLIGLGIFAYWFKEPPIWLLFIVGASLSVINAFFSPAKSASIPRLVSKEDLNEANGLSAATQSIMPLFGVAAIGGIGAFVMDWKPEMFLTIICTFNALTFIGSAYFINRLPSIEPERDGDEDKHDSMWDETKEGIRYILKKPVVRTILLAESVLFLFTAPIMTVIITVNEQWFNGTAKNFTLMESSFAGGMLISSLVMSKVHVARPAKPYIIAMFICGAGIAGLSLCRQLEWFMVVNFIIGLTVSVANVPIQTYIQHVVPDEYLGRVNSALTMITFGVMPFSMILAGNLLAFLGIENMFLIMGGGMGFGLLLALMNKDFMRASTQVKQKLSH